MKKIILLLLWCLPFLVQAQTKVTFDNNVETALANNTTTMTISSYQTPLGANRLLVVSIGFRQESSGSITAITYNGQNLTKGVCTNQIFSGSIYPYSCIWYLPLGSGETIVSDVEITFGAFTNYAIANASTYQGVDQVSPIGATRTNRGLSASSSTIVLAANPLDGVVDNLLSGGPGLISPGSDQVPVSVNTNESVNGSSFQPSFGGNITMTWFKPFTSYTHVAMVINSCGACLALPLEWLTFKAEERNKQVELFWETQAEINNRGFEIQHSKDADNWQSIGFVEGTNRPIGNYYFNHQPQSRGLHYYRLKQMDWDGAYDFSEVTSVKLNSNFAVNVYPNPVVNQLHVDGLTTGALTIFTQQGQVVFKSIMEENNTFDISDLPNGSYILTIETEGEQVVQQLVKN